MEPTDYRRVLHGISGVHATAYDSAGEIDAAMTGRIDIDMVIVGLGALSAGLVDDIWTKVVSLPDTDGLHWVCDAHYGLIPKGVSEDKVAVLVEFIKFALQPEQQAYSYDAGYFYPGPAVKDVPLSMAPRESQDIIAKFGRPEYEDWIANNPVELPLEPSAMVAAFRLWDEKGSAGRDFHPRNAGCGPRRSASGAPYPRPSTGTKACRLPLCPSLISGSIG
ncbi:MAG: hypothetical protein QM682_13735 [Paracoccus sp. (in: a-proteobacteria)]|uniref:hypothetical protein n=1 Tax=Paracoccus sp. TaxID=267 RepID=UPI0039E35410